MANGKKRATVKAKAKVKPKRNIKSTLIEKPIVVKAKMKIK